MGVCYRATEMKECLKEPGAVVHVHDGARDEGRGVDARTGAGDVAQNWCARARQSSARSPVGGNWPAKGAVTPCLSASPALPSSPHPTRSPTPCTSPRPPNAAPLFLPLLPLGGIIPSHNRHGPGPWPGPWRRAWRQRHPSPPLPTPTTCRAACARCRLQICTRVNRSGSVTRVAGTRPW